MAIVSYDEIVSSLLCRIEDYEFLGLSDEDAAEFLHGWIHIAGGKPYVRRLFSSFVLDDDRERLSYEMAHATDEGADHDFVVDVLALGAGIQWLAPKINSTVNIHQQYGSKEEKFYSQSSHIAELRNLRKDWVREQRGIIRDRGYVSNTYLDGEA